MRKARWPQLWNQHTAAGRHFDRLSVPEWLDESGIDSSSRFGRLMKATVVSEYGGDPSEQSSYNLISLLALGTGARARRRTTSATTSSAATIS